MYHAFIYTNFQILLSVATKTDFSMLHSNTLKKIIKGIHLSLNNEIVF